MRVALSIAVAAVAVSAATALAAEADFVGAKACKSCHSDVYDSWSRTRHAKAAESLGASASSRRCQACHDTGDAPAGAAYFRGVQCESCHGAGAGYAPDDVMRNRSLARLLGLRDLSTPALRATLCQSCHSASTRIAPFDADTAWKSIAHGKQP